MLNPSLRFFLKSRNLKELTMSPKIHSTYERTEDIDLLNSSISGVRTAFLNGACKRTRRGYALTYSWTDQVHHIIILHEKVICKNHSPAP